MSFWSINEIDRKILLLMAAGETNEEIANHFHYTATHMQKKYFHELYKKLDVDHVSNTCRRTAAVAVAFREHIIE